MSHKDECGVTPKSREILVRKLESGPFLFTLLFSDLCSGGCHMCFSKGVKLKQCGAAGTFGSFCLLVKCWFCHAKCLFKIQWFIAIQLSCLKFLSCAHDVTRASQQNRHKGNKMHKTVLKHFAKHRGQEVRTV